MIHLFRLLLICAILGVSAPAQAYFCWAPRDIRDELHDADVVFTGDAAGIENMGASKEELGTPRQKIRFLVVQAWKGLEEDEKEVYADTEALYEYDFKPGQQYLVIGFRIYEDRISMVGCPRVELTDKVTANIEKLGDPVYSYASAAPLPDGTQATAPVIGAGQVVLPPSDQAQPTSSSNGSGGNNGNLDWGGMLTGPAPDKSGAPEKPR